MSSTTNTKVIGNQVVHKQPVQSEGASAATSEVTFLNKIDETNFKALRAQKRHSKLNHRNRRRKIQYMLPDQHHVYSRIWKKNSNGEFVSCINPNSPQGCGHQSLDSYDLPKSYLQGDHWHYYGLTWIYGEFGPRKRKFGSKRYTKNWYCSNVFGSGSNCKHTKKQILMKDIMDESNRFTN